MSILDNDGLYFLPLGGADGIGMNMYAYASNGRLIVVDCGYTFLNDDYPGMDLAFADPSFLENYADRIDGLFITAILTVIGFSVHDTIVVFDRIRENLRYYSKKMSFGDIVDASVNQTLTRSLNTSLTTLITLLALYFWGGVTTRDFVLAMILGIIIGTYSSIFFCSMLVDFWNDRQQKAKQIAA